MLSEVGLQLFHTLFTMVGHAELDPGFHHDNFFLLLVSNASHDMTEFHTYHRPFDDYLGWLLLSHRA
jgi:hypothetical protein